MLVVFARDNSKLRRGCTLFVLGCSLRVVLTSVSRGALVNPYNSPADTVHGKHHFAKLSINGGGCFSHVVGPGSAESLEGPQRVNRIREAL
mmetsp:Transcript_29652/g.71759  ORF Transcript_29652/g.71759 Transcript_29652/m.71759 type:complete len:91 (+) Transcript_29652:1154-1426(+)